MAAIQLTGLSLERPQNQQPLRIKRQDKAAYGVGGKGFFDDKCKLWPVGSALYFDGEPNKDLFPLNKLAHDRMNEYLTKIDDLGEKKAKKENKAYVRAEIKEWDESAIHDEIPMPEYVMAVPSKEPNEAIR